VSLKDDIAAVQADKPKAKPAPKKRTPAKKAVSKVISKPEAIHRLFAEALIRNELNATAAYKEIKPNVTDKTAAANGHKLLRTTETIEILTPMLERLFIKAGIETEYVFRRWVEFAQATPLDYFRVDEDGYMILRPTDDLTPAQRTNLREIKLTTTKSADGEYINQNVQVKVVDQQKAVDTIGKHLGLLVDKLDADDVERIGDLLERGINRIRETKDLDGWKDVILDAEFAEVK